MDTVKAIKVLEGMKDGNVPSSYSEFCKEYNNKLDKVIALLKRGEKFEAMWEELNDVYFHSVGGLMKLVKQKYLPEPVKKTITIEFEAEKDHIITHHINILKADLERRKDCPTMKYTFKE